MSETQSAPSPLLKVKELHKHFPIFSQGIMRRKISEVKAVNGISFTLNKGETLGIVGESGCGKTTAARCLLKAIKPTSGEILFQSPSMGEIEIAGLNYKQLKPLRREMQMIFQDPFSSLNPRMTVGDIVGEPLQIHRLGNRSQRRDKTAEILEKVGLQAIHMQRYPHAFSGGQRQRIGIARALILNPSLIVADEAVSALDVSVQAQVINLLQDLQEEFGLTYIFVAHDLSVVRHICNRVAVMYRGKIVELEETETLFTDPQHAYTKVLLSAIPSPDPDVKLKPILKGSLAEEEMNAASA